MPTRSTPDELLVLAKAVEQGVFSCLLAAERAETEFDANGWFAQANRLESNFKRDTGRHYTELTQPGLKVFFT